MGCIDRPTKEQVRAWLAERRLAAQPPPDCEQIRRQLGWQYSSPEMCDTGTQQLKENT